MTEFVAIDGEADDQGRYVLLCSSTGQVLHDPAGITTKAALDFVLELAATGRVLVCFGLNYDVNQWLAQLGPSELRRLSETGKTTWRLRYRLDWLPAKYFAIKDYKRDRYVKVCEVFGFFQSSFVKALEAWGMQAPAEVVAMKGKRGTFTAAELERVTRYCQAECALLVELMGRLAEACHGADCAPRRDWIGAGSIASSLLRRNGVHAHHAYDADLADRAHVEEGILGAYYGARVELLAQGVLVSGHARDIRSAYPAAATQLPSLAGATVRWRRKYRPELDWSIWRVRWSGQVHGQLAPFPVRGPAGAIFYPASGEGCYHQTEVRNALALGYELQVLEGWELVVRDYSRPFTWIAETYKHRAALKAAGDPAEKALKLGMNSVYGKLAQGYSVSARPPFQNYWWAGHITAVCRSRMLELAHRSRLPVMIATDGLYCARAGVKGSGRPTLGSWEPGEVAEFFCAQPGVYYGVKDGHELVKSRGFFAKEVDYGELRAGWERDGYEYVHHYTSRRFIGLKVALARNRLDLWRQWCDERRSITLLPDRKVIRSQTERDPATGMVLLFPPDGPLVSRPYTPKQSLYDDPTDAQLENMVADDQPHYDLVGE